MVFELPIFNQLLHNFSNSHPEEIHYNLSTYNYEKIELEHQIGPQVVHLYTITNQGPATVNEAEVSFVWPYATLADDDLLYLLEQPQTQGKITCEATVANEKNYLVSRIWCCYVLCNYFYIYSLS